MVSFKIPAKYAKDFEHYIGGIILAGGAGGVLLALQHHADWKELLWALALAFISPLQHRAGVAKKIAGLFSNTTGLPEAQVEAIVQKGLDKSSEVIADHNPPIATPVAG